MNLSLSSQLQEEKHKFNLVLVVQKMLAENRGHCFSFLFFFFCVKMVLLVDEFEIIIIMITIEEYCLLSKIYIYIYGS